MIRHRESVVEKRVAQDLPDEGIKLPKAGWGQQPKAPTKLTNFRKDSYPKIFGTPLYVDGITYLESMCWFIKVSQHSQSQLNISFFGMKTASNFHSLHQRDSTCTSLTTTLHSETEFEGSSSPV